MQELLPVPDVVGEEKLGEIVGRRVIRADAVDIRELVDALDAVCLGGDHEGYRLNRLYKESLNEAELITELDGLFADFKEQRVDDESFGDFTFKQLFNQAKD